MRIVGKQERDPVRFFEEESEKNCFPLSYLSYVKAQESSQQIREKLFQT